MSKFIFIYDYKTLYFSVITNYVLTNYNISLSNTYKVDKKSTSNKKAQQNYTIIINICQNYFFMTYTFIIFNEDHQQ